MYKPKSQEPIQIEKVYSKQVLSKELKRDAEWFAAKVRDHQKIHDMTTYLGWAHDIVWGFCITTLRKLGASYAEAKTIHHPMVDKATVWEVFQLMSQQVHPFSWVADTYKKVLSEGEYIFRMTW